VWQSKDIFPRALPQVQKIKKRKSTKILKICPVKVGAFCRDIKREKRGKRRDGNGDTMAAQVCFDLAPLFLAKQVARKVHIIH